MAFEYFCQAELAGMKEAVAQTKLAAVILAALPAIAFVQDTEGADDEVPRMSAELPDRVSGTDERAPEPVPHSSAEEIGEIDVANLKFGVGQPATPEMIDPINIEVSPDGVGAPSGSGTYADGEELYALHFCGLSRWGS